MNEPGAQEVVTPDEEFDPWQLPALIGAEVSAAVMTAQNVLDRCQGRRAIARNDFKTLNEAAAAVRRIGMKAQQLSRLGQARLRQSHERLTLGAVLQKVMQDNDARYYDSGLLIEQRLQLVEVIVDPGLLFSLCEAAIDCAARYGQSLVLSTVIMNWPQHGLLTVRARPHVPDPERMPARKGEVLDWVLLRRLAAEMGVEARRTFYEDHVEIQVQFPRTVRHLEGLTTMELETGDSQFSADSRPLAGHRVLLITGDARLQWELQAICKELRLALQTVRDCGEAVRICERERPDLLIVDEAVRDHRFDELREDLARYEVVMPCIEITRDPNVLEMAGWDAGSVSRVGRNAMRTQLPSILAMELARAL